MKINIGSGAERIEGFTNVDLYDETADVIADISELPFENNSVEEIIARQVIEHIPYNQSRQVFSEMYRVLNSQGTATLETPDIDVVCRKILEEGLQDKWIYNLVGEYYRPWDKARYDDWEMNAASIHRNPWNYNRLYKLAKEVGFSKIEKLGGPSDKYPFEENLWVVLTK